MPKITHSLFPSGFSLAHIIKKKIYRSHLRMEKIDA